MSDQDSPKLEEDPVLGPYVPGEDRLPDFHVPEVIDLPPFTPTEHYQGKPLPRTWEEGKRLGWDDESLEALLREGLITPPNPMLQDVSGASMSQRIELTFQLLKRQDNLPAEVRGQISSLLVDGAPMIAGTALVWAAGHYFGVSEVVDLILLTLGVMALGPQLLELNDDLYRYFIEVENARTVRDLDRASAVLSRVVTTIGITAFVALLTRMSKGRVSSAKNRAAWKLQDLGRRHLRSRWPGGRPSPSVLGADIRLGTPQEPIPLITPQTRHLGGLQAIESAARKAGMTVAEFEYTLNVATRHGVHIYVRPAGAGTLRLRASGALAKREWMKMNTVNADDIALGAPPHSRDKVAHFHPKPWKEIEPHIPAADRARVKARWEVRQASYAKTNGEVQQNISAGKIRLEEGGVLVDAQTGRYYTGDIDYFEVRAPDGRTLKPGDPLFTVVQNALERGPTFAQHQTHMTWRPYGPFEEKIYWDVVVRHGTNEPLIWLQPTGHVSLYYADLPMCWR